MFNDTVNSAFKHFVENGAMHETAKRLYQAALVLSKGQATKPGEVAAFFGVTQQLLKNWESRGLSQRGMVSVCEQHAVDLRWLSCGEGDPPAQGLDAQTGDLLSFAPAAPQATPGTLTQALRLIDDALAPLDTQARNLAVRILGGLASPGSADLVASMLSAAIEATSSKLRAA